MTHSVDILLFCPACFAQHIDHPKPELDWTNPPHRTHLCQYCGHYWRPADVPTNGVAAIETHGVNDMSPYPALDSKRVFSAVPDLMTFLSVFARQITNEYNAQHTDELPIHQITFTVYKGEEKLQPV